MSTFTRLDNTIFEHIPAIGALGLSVYAALCKRADNHTRRCWPSYETLARDAGVCRTLAKRKARQLADIGLIRIEPRQDPETGQWTSPLFTVLDSLPTAPRPAGEVSATLPPGAPDTPRTILSPSELNPTTTAPLPELASTMLSTSVEGPLPEPVVVIEEEKQPLTLPPGIPEPLARKALAHLPDQEEKQAVLDTVAQARRIETTPARYLFGVLKHWDSAAWQAQKTEQQTAQRQRKQTRQTTAARLAAIQAASEQRAPTAGPRVDVSKPRAGKLRLREVLRL